MKSTLDFQFEQLPLKALIKESELYKLMRLKIEAVKDQAEKRRQYEILSVAELNTNIEILYLYYTNNILIDVFKLIEPNGENPSENSLVYIVNWGNNEKKQKMMSLICKMLSQLDIDNISASAEKTYLYHKMTTIIERNRKENRHFLFDATFWKTFFKLYEKYHELK